MDNPQSKGRRAALKSILSTPILIGAGATWSADPSTLRRKIWIVVNDISPQSIAGRAPYQILSCKDLVRIRNAFAGYTSLGIEQSSELNRLYDRVRKVQEERVALLKQRYDALQASWKTSELERAKFERAKAFFDLGLASIVPLAGAILIPETALMLTAAVSVYSLGDGIYQLFRVEDESGAVESIVFFNDAKLGGLAVLSKILKSNTSEVLERINKRSWWALAWMFRLYDVFYRTSNSVSRLETLQAITEMARSEFDAAKLDGELLLKSKATFVEYLRVASMHAASAVEKVWTVASLNECAFAGSLGLTPVLNEVPAGPSLGRKP